MCYHLILETLRFCYPDEFLLEGMRCEQPEVQIFFNVRTHCFKDMAVFTACLTIYIDECRNVPKVKLRDSQR